jgi:hypothetical protein
MLESADSGADKRGDTKYSCSEGSEDIEVDMGDEKGERNEWTGPRSPYL